jgi:chromosomal replication initiation ATPase DnaA
MDEYLIITETILSLIKTKTNFNDSIFNLWFGDLKLLSLTNDKAVFSTPTNLRRSILLSKHKKLLEECLFDVIGFEVEIEIESIQKDNEIFNTPIKEVAPLKPDEESDKRKEIINKFLNEPKENNIIKEYTFENFIEGNSNKFAKNASMSFSGATYSVINTGSGKFLKSVLPLAV